MLKEIRDYALPVIQFLIESQIIPRFIRKGYEHLDDYINERIDKLVKLKNKLLETDDPIKKSRHEIGLKLGTNTLRAFAEKLNKAADELEK